MLVIISDMKVKIPLIDIFTLAGSFYTGYWEGKGLDVRDSVEYITKYGSTVYAFTSTPLKIKFFKSMNNKIKKRLAQLDEDKRPANYNRIIEKLDESTQTLERCGYVKPTLVLGMRVALETTTGYLAGKIYSQWF